MMEREFAKFFVRLVNELIADNGGKEKLFESLRQYKISQDLDVLLVELKCILDEPLKLELYEFMRPLILLHHQLEFSQRVSCLPGTKLRTVRLYRRPGEGLGFAVRGGFEHGVGIFVTQLTPGSQAVKQGLKIGDEIVRINGFTISEAIHDDVLNLIKSRDDIVLRVTHIGMVPVKEETSVPVTWKYVDDMVGSHQSDTNDSNRKPRDVKIFVDTTGYGTFGCGILSGPSNFPGIFIEKIRPGSLAEEVGLQVGDQIVSVNDVNFQNITHDQAVLAMKSSRQLTMMIRQQVGLRLFSQLADQRLLAANNGRNSSSSTPNTSSSSSAARMQPSPNRNARQIATDTSDSPSSPSSSEPTRSSRTQDAVVDETPSETPSESQLIEQLFGHQELNERMWQRNTPMRMTEMEEGRNKSVSSSLVTAAEVHSDAGMLPEKGKKDEVQREKRTSPRGQSDFSSEIREELQKRKLSQQSSPISGAAAVAMELKLQKSVRPGLLGLGESFVFLEDVPPESYAMFSSWELDKRSLRSIKFKKSDDLGVGLEGGLGSPLAGKICVSMIFDDGIARKSGRMQVGDQLMAVNGQKLLDVTVGRAQIMIQGDKRDTVELLFCESSLVNEEDTVTYF